MDLISSQIADNLQAVRNRIAVACDRSGRELDSVQLVAVTKYAQVEWMQALYECGVRDFGESRPQQLVERAPSFPEDIRWHLIGHLQRNKVRPILPRATLTHSVDAFRLLSRMDMLAEEIGLEPSVLLEVNITGEAAKDGFTTETLVSGWSSVMELRRVRVLGLMTMAAFSGKPEDARPVFCELRELRDRLSGMSPASSELPELSMGMSGDFEVAIEEGATCVRIGSSLFEGLDRV
jgi:PLP dependent protein